MKADPVAVCAGPGHGLCMPLLRGVYAALLFSDFVGFRLRHSQSRHGGYGASLLHEHDKSFGTTVNRPV